MRKAGKIIGIIAIILLTFVFLIWIYHQVKLSQEKKLLQPLGKIVDVNGHHMSIYTEGDAEKTLVFLSGGGTCSPILDFKSLYSLLSADYQIAVVEKLGYGFSDAASGERTIEMILAETRACLSAAGVSPPYVLCPHSMSGIEALYWAQQYPEEVEAIIGLDMAVPEYYTLMDLNIPLIELGQFAGRIGITRLLSGIAESDAIKYGTLTEEEKAVYRAVFYSRTATAPMIEEVKTICENADVVGRGDVPQLPMLLFLSDGSGGTGFDESTWRQIPKDYLAQVSGSRYIELDCPHYVHDYEYKRISVEIKEFLNSIA